MIKLSRTANRQVEALLKHFEAKGRQEAAQNLLQALQHAGLRMERLPQEGLPAPRSYPELAAAGRFWTKEGPYWFSYIQEQSDVVVTGIYFVASDIPNRL